MGREAELAVKAIFDLMNQMQAASIIGKYAIGGAVGATFYLEPSATLDVDIFVTLPAGPNQALLSLTPLYEFLQSRGGTVEGEHIVIDGWPVQFLPAADALDQEALAGAVETEVEGVKTWVMPAEHLAAIALRTGRPKDHNRVLQFLEHNSLDEARLQGILQRHGLSAKWARFQHKYLGDAHE
jgi:hypothetical protein